MSKITAFILAMWLLAGPAGGSTQEPIEGCGCPDLLRSLTAKVEVNYPGYHLEVRGQPREEVYLRHRAAMTRATEHAAAGLDCLSLLQEYVAWFEEGHLFVGGRPRITEAADSARLLAVAPRVEIQEAEIYVRFDTVRKLDPVEGIWMDATGLKIAIVPDDGERFLAIVLASAVEAWRPGDVKAQLTALPDGSYDAIVYDDARAATRPHVYTRGMSGGARLQRGGLLLHMPPTTWGKLHPTRPGDEGLIDPVDPRAPTARTVGDRTVVFHVPSNVPSYGPRLRALVEQYRNALARAETLIIDVRGNEGGSTPVTDVFLPFLVTPDKRPARYLAGGEPAVLASPDNIAFFERAGWGPAGLVGRLRDAAAGEIVPFADPAPANHDNPPGDIASERPRQVAILTDAMTVSAAEAFVLRAMRNEKVTLFGQPTGSSIDYQTVSIVGFGCRAAGLYVGYPTIIGSDRLPEGGVRPTGIVPDVPLDPTDGDPILAIIEYYRRR